MTHCVTRQRNDDGSIQLPVPFTSITATLATRVTSHSSPTSLPLSLFLYLNRVCTATYSTMSSTFSSSSSTAGDSPITLSTFYDYDPVLGILIAATIIFGLQTAIILIQSIRSRTYFLFWLVLFTACECGGYIAFCAFQQNPSLNSYLAELILIVLAPNFVTLVNYVVISRIIPWAGFEPKTFLARRGYLVPTFFLSSDLLCLTLQAIGGSQLSKSRSGGTFNQSTFNVGRNLTLAGISAQLGFQTIFAFLGMYIYAKMPNRAVRQELRWAWLCMLITMILVSMRNIYRIVEFAGGQHSAIDQTSVPYFVLDLLLMLLTGCAFIIFDLGSNWVLPERIRRAALLETADDMNNNGAGRRSVEDGKGQETVVQMREIRVPNIENTVNSPEDSV